MATYRGFEGATPFKARQAYAQSLGYTGYRQMRTARAEHRPRARDVLAAPRATERQVGEAGRIVKAGRGADVRAAVQAAADRGERVSLIVTMDKGEGFKTHRIDKFTGAATPVGPVEKGQGAVSGGDVVRGGSIQVVSGPAVAAGGGGGIDAGDLLDYFDMYGDVWDAIADLWDEEYP